MTGILNLCLVANIQFHDTLHGLHIVRGTRTDSLKAKLLQHMMTMREEVLYYIFLDLHNAFDTLERDYCIDILEAYGVGLRAICLLLK